MTHDVCLFEMSVKIDIIHMYYVVSYLKDVFHILEKNLVEIFMCLDNDIHLTIFTHCTTTIGPNYFQVTKFSVKGTHKDCNCP